MKTVNLHSRIIQYFTVDTLIAINEIINNPGSTNERGNAILKMLEEHVKERGGNVMPLGSGTNRVGIQIEDAVFKIALDKHGCIDNRREYKYTDKLQPYVVKAYECTEDGIVASFEPFRPFELKDWESPDIKEQVMDILKEVSRYFFIGDIGYNDKNYGNWGFRKSDGKIGILDFAYIYTVSYKIFSCTRCNAKTFLKYDDKFVDLVCPACGSKYTFGDIRKRISRDEQEAEIGNVCDNSYVVSSEFSEVEMHPDYTLSLYSETEKRNEKAEKRKAERQRNRDIIDKLDKKEECYSFDVDEPTTFDGILKSIINQGHTE